MFTSTRVRGAVAVTATALGLALLAPPGTAAGAPPTGPVEPTATSYTNPVSAPVADTYADPAVIRGKDGWWYAYGTTDPLREGDTERHLLPISRSQDLVSWEYVGDAFTEATKPAWAEAGAGLWAPDIRYVDGQYRLYYVVTETTMSAETGDNAIGVAFSDSPAGPWTDSGDPVVDPRRQGPDNYLWTFDPHHVSGPDGEEYLFYGSYYGGIWVTELDDDGTEAVGTATRVAIDNKYEGAYVVQHDGWWYLMASSANCCAGPTTGYSVHVGRSQSLTGPYVDREGVPLNQSRAGGTPVLAQNGNRWIGTGHNAVVTDLAGQDWAVYHAIDRGDPYLTGTDGINERPMLIDRLDWIDGWPTVRAGAWASDDEQPGPATGPVTDFSDGADGAWATAGGWRTVEDAQAGTSLATKGNGVHTILSRASLPADVRVEADVRSTAGSTGEYGLLAGGRHGQRGTVEAVIDPAAGTLVLRTLDGNRVTGQQTSPLPPGYQHEDWHSLVLEVRDGVATAELTHARLFDPLARAELTVPGGGAEGPAGATARGEGVQFDNLSALPAAELVTERVPGPQPGELLPEYSDEFDGAALADGWEAVRDPQVTLSGGQLSWPVEAADLTGSGNDAGVLLRDVPDGDWTAETRLSIDLGTDAVRNFQQGGLIAYVDDDLFARLSHVAIWNTRQTEFGKEMPYAGRLSYGGTIIGPPADTTWLRLTHRTAANGERLLQASTSTDGETWVVGGVWTLPEGSDLRIGLVSHGRTDPAQAAATSQFDYLRVYAD
ncbi:family 43 glycosylhydrolase [Blastococcus sp. SYSU D00669]